MNQTSRGIEQAINVVGGSSFGVYPKVSVSKTYNMYMSDDFLIPFAGFKRIKDVFPEGQGRGLFYSSRGGFMLAVINQSVIKLTVGGNGQLNSQTVVGSLNTQFGEVYIDENLSSQICIVDGLEAWIYNYAGGASTLTVQTAGALGSGALIPTYVEYHNTYFLFGNKRTAGTDSRWYAYEYASANAIQERTNGAAFALSTKPDNPIAIKRIPNQSANVLVFGSTVTEIHQDTGGNDGYTRNNYINIDYGLAAIETLASNDEHVTFLGVNEKNDPVLIDFSGQGATRISTDGVDHMLNAVSRPDRSTADFYRQDGHLFYIITFYDPDDNFTLAYDFNTGSFINLADWQLNKFPARKIVTFNQTNYFVSLNNAAVYELSTKYTTQNENETGADPVEDPDLVHEIQRIRITDPFRSNRNKRFIVNWFNLTIEQGNEGFTEQDNCIEYIITEDGDMVITEDNVVVIPEDAYEDGCIVGPYRPRVDLAISIDGGVTWSNYVSRTLNAYGNRRNILSWNRLGACNEIIFKLRFWNAGRVCVANGMMDIRL